MEKESNPSVSPQSPKELLQVEKFSLPRTIHLIPLDYIDGFAVRPGFYEINGATAIPGGVNFTVYSHGATSIELLLFHREEETPFAVLPFPQNYRIGNVYSMIVFKLNIEDFEYAYRVDGPYEPEKGKIFDKSKYLLDPYAKAVTGQSEWGSSSPRGQHYKARVVKDDFDWGDLESPLIPMEDLVIYELHVRGFTKDGSSGVKHPGTFAGLMEKLPYLKELGINAIELMPIFEFDEMQDYREAGGQKLYNYWGYSTVSFFAPNTSYTASLEFNREGTELKNLILACHQLGMEVYLDVVFNHTAEGNERGPFFSFKGFDNNIYYLLTPDGKYYNFSGCGNTLNCNHPIVHQMIMNCLRYWVTTYRVDGFRFDLASILGRNEDPHDEAAPPSGHGLRPHSGGREAHRRGLGRGRAVSGGVLPLLEPLGGVERPVPGRYAPVSQGGPGLRPGGGPADHRVQGHVRPQRAQGRLRQLHHLSRRVYPVGSVLLQREAQREKRLEQHRRGKRQQQLELRRGGRYRGPRRQRPPAADVPQRLCSAHVFQGHPHVPGGG